ncbi:MAG: type VI secretion system tip protein VgrG [Polyangiaceae bacterium]|nr:type VI secretion system tip protein VgrG [Polyangiaceae bacterium]
MARKTIFVRVESDAFGCEVELRELRGHDAIGRPFELELLVVAAGTAVLDDEALIGAPVAVVFEREGVELRRLFGMIAACTDALQVKEHASYRLRVVPRFWGASLIETLDIFMNLSVPDIVRKKLALIDLHEGADYDMRLEGTYHPREFVVQFKETDLAFVSRLCEHYGISLFFEHRDGSDRLVFGDRNDAFQPLLAGAVRFEARGEALGVYELEATTRMVPRHFVQRDYNYRNPAIDLTGQTDMPDGHAGGVIEYGGHFKSDQEGQWLAALRAEERRSERRVYHGKSNVAGLSAGQKLTVEGHPRGDLTLVVTEVRHAAKQVALGRGDGDEREYHNEFVAVHENTVFRPRRVTPKPRVSGVLTAVVDAESRGRYAEIDDDGRYKVKFMFDTSGPDEGKASRLVRMMQPHSGAGYGMHFPLRPGTEVLITFVDGDPDRPIIAGTVPNPQTASPVVAENATRNVIRTGGGNEINIDDQESSERIKLSTPHASTRLQLGAPNDPESGMTAATTGAISSIAVSGQTSLASATNSFSLLLNYIQSSSIETVAAKPDAWAAFLGISQITFAFLDTAIGLADTVMQWIQQFDAITLAAKKKDLEKAKATALDKQDALRQAELEQKAALDALVAATSPALSAAEKTALATARTAYEEALDKLATDRTALATMTATRDDAKRRGVDTTGFDLGIGTAPTDPAVATAGSGQERTVKLDEWAVDGTEPPTGDKKKALDDALAAIVTAHSTTANNVTTKDAVATLAETYAAKVAATTTARTAAATATDAQASAQKSFDDKSYETTDGDAAQGLATARSVLQLARTGLSLINTIIQIVALVKKALTAAVKEEGQLTKAIASYTPIAPVSAKLPLGAGLKPQVPPEKYRHTLGSQGNTTVYADKRLLLHSPEVIVSAAAPLPKDAAAAATAATTADTAGKLVLIAGAKALLLSNGTAELNGKTKSIVASNTEVNLIAKDNLAGTTAVKLVAKATGTLDVTSDKKTKLLSKDSLDLVVTKTGDTGTLELKTCADQFLKLDQGAKKLSGKAHEAFELSASKTALLLAGGADIGAAKAGLSLDAVTDGGKLVGKAGDWKLTLSAAKGVELGKQKKQLYAGDDRVALSFDVATALKLNASGAMLSCGMANSLKLETSGVTIAGSQVKIG